MPRAWRNILDANSTDVADDERRLATAMDAERERALVTCTRLGDAIDSSGGWCYSNASSRVVSQFGATFRLPAGHVVPDANFAAALALHFHNRSVIDLGAGVGLYGHAFASLDSTVRWRGYDGGPNAEAFTHGYVQWANLGWPLPNAVAEVAEWVMSLEVGEHLPAPSERAFVRNLHVLNSCGVVLSWARPRQSGKGHVNCHEAEYLRALFERGGLYSLDVEATARLTLAAKKRHNLRRNVQVFRRSGSGPECGAKPDKGPKADIAPARAQS